MRIFVVFFLAVFSLRSMAAEAPDVAAQKLEGLRSKIEKEERSRRQILSALYQINRQMRKNLSERTKIKRQLMGAQINLERTEGRLKELEKKSMEMRTKLAERLRALHRLGGPSSLRILFSAASSSQVDRNLKILSALSRQDREDIIAYQKTVDEISSRRSHLAKRVEELQRLQGDLQSREARLSHDQDLKNRLLQGAKRKHLFAVRDLQRFKEQTRRAGFEETSLLDTLLRPSFSEQKGKLPPPLESARVHRPFGIERAHENSWMLMHKGLRLSAPRGSSVRAVFDGVVSWVGRIGESGQTVIIDHGDHYYSVYSEVEQVKVEIGQAIKQLDAVAVVGRSPLEKTPGLHFEIRHFSEPDDPQAWMKGTIL